MAANKKGLMWNKLRNTEASTFTMKEWPAVLYYQGFLSSQRHLWGEKSVRVGVWWWEGGWGGEKGQGPLRCDWEIPPLACSPPLLNSFSSSPLSSSNPWPLKTSRRPPLIMTRLSNPIGVAQTQGSALNPLESDCFSGVKWLCPPCHSPGHRHCYSGCLELPEWEPHKACLTHPPHSHWPHRGSGVCRLWYCNAVT